MYLEIITPDKKVYEGEVDLARFPGSDGSFAVLKNHAPIISTLQQGEIKIVTSNREEIFFQVNGGVVEVKDNHIIVLAESV
ncbi:MAG: ATP synthase F1 subunit epsilon [Bacteroidota bacterium]